MNATVTIISSLSVLRVLERPKQIKHLLFIYLVTLPYLTYVCTSHAYMHACNAVHFTHQH